MNDIVHTTAQQSHMPHLLPEFEPPRFTGDEVGKPQKTMLCHSNSGKSYAEAMHCIGKQSNAAML